MRHLRSRETASRWARRASGNRRRGAQLPRSLWLEAFDGPSGHLRVADRVGVLYEVVDDHCGQTRGGQSQPEHRGGILPDSMSLQLAEVSPTP